jgi:hypothetical protein
VFSGSGTYSLLDGSFGPISLTSASFPDITGTVSGTVAADCSSVSGSAINNGCVDASVPPGTFTVTPSLP